MNSLYDNIYEIDNTIEGLHFKKIEGVSIVGDWLSDAYKHPIQYYAYTNTRPCDDDPYEGVGWTPSEAVRELLKVLKAEKGK